MEQIKISIIVPVYKIESMLPRCLDSILAQTYRNIEIIAVDDGSPDNCGKILDDYAIIDSRIKVIHQENCGVTKARFTGMRAASGEWIGFVDGDDYIEPDMYERLLQNALKYKADISHCGYQMVFPNRVDYYYNTSRLAEQDNLTGQYDLLDGSSIEPGLCNKLYNKTLLHSLFHSGIEDMGIRINEDLLMNFYLFRVSNKSVFEDFCPYHYIVRASSAANTRNRECHVTDPIKVGKILCDETKGHQRLYPLALRYYVRRLMSAAMQNDFPSLSKEAIKMLRKLDRTKIPQKERVMSFMVAYCKPIYRMIRWGYEKITRVNHKYDLE